MARVKHYNPETKQWEYADTVLGGGSGIDVTASVGQTIVVKEVDSNGKPTKWEAVEHQPRTHWSEETLMLPETTLVPSEDGGTFTPLDVPSAGSACKVMYNGTEYICEAQDATSLVGGGVILGNFDLLSESGDTGEPFVIVLMAPVEGGGQAILLDGSETCTLSIMGTSVVKIPDKYLPEYLPFRFNLVMDGGTVAAAITTFTLEPIVRSGLMVIADLVIYTQTIRLYLVSMEETDNGLELGFSNGAFKFLLTPNEDGSYSVENQTGEL